MQSPIEATMAGLARRMQEAHTAVHPKKNPVATGLETLSRDQLEYILGQYSLFPARIVSLLYAARDSARAHAWDDVAAELTRNIGEELGTESDGISHYELLLRGITELTGDRAYEQFKNMAASPATEKFLSHLENAVGHADIARAVGATYALESSAVPELIIVRSTIERFLELTAHRSIGGILKSFFDMHLGTWEPGHEQGLHAAIPAYLAHEDVPTFRTGFEAVMDAMDEWWMDLAREVRATH